MFSQRKRSGSLPRKADYSKCLICQIITDEHGPQYKLTGRGFGTFKDAIETRKDCVYNRLWNDLQCTEEFLARKPVIHRNCRSDYTHKTNLAAKRLRTESTTGETPLRTSRKSTIDLKSVCFLCDKEHDGKGDRSLICITTVERQRSIHDKAKELNDETVLLKIMGHGDKLCLDRMANDFRYHLRCMNRFMATRGKRERDSSGNLTEHDPAFLELVSEISIGLLNEKHAYFLGQLSQRYSELLSNHGIATNTAYIADRLMKRLLKHFGIDIQFVTLKGTERLLCASSLSDKELCDQVVGLQAELYR